jgi:hypothetical protein
LRRETAGAEEAVDLALGDVETTVIVFADGHAGGPKGVDFRVQETDDQVEAGADVRFEAGRTRGRQAGTSMPGERGAAMILLPLAALSFGASRRPGGNVAVRKAASDDAGRTGPGAPARHAGGHDWPVA